MKYEIQSDNDIISNRTHSHHKKRGLLREYTRKERWTKVAKIVQGGTGKEDKKNYNAIGNADISNCRK